MRRYLLDTHLVYWWMTANPCLGQQATDLLASPGMLVSVASIWEMVLKNTRGQLPLPDGPVSDALLAQGFALLPVLPRHVDAVRNLACDHADPFDRLLIGQARDEGAVLLTRDAAILALGLEGIVRT